MKKRRAARLLSRSKNGCLGIWSRMRTLRLPDPFPRGRPREKLEIGTSAWAADSCLVEWSSLEREWLEPEPTRARRASTWAGLLGNLAWKLHSLFLDAVLRTLLRFALSVLAGAAAAFVAGVLIAFCGLFFAGDGYGFLASETFAWAEHGIHLSIGDTILLVTGVLATAATWRLLASRR
jgi:hypothetical protein